MKLHVGFTGSRHGMDLKQEHALMNQMADLSVGNQVVGHHGDCVGSDALFHDLAYQLGWEIHVHPPTIDAFRAFCEGDVTHYALNYLARDRVIVDSSDIVLGTPNTFKPIPGSGTWYTLNYAKISNVRSVVFLPLCYKGEELSYD